MKILSRIIDGKTVYEDDSKSVLKTVETWADLAGADLTANLDWSLNKEIGNMLGVCGEMTLPQLVLTMIMTIDCKEEKWRGHIS